MHKEFWESEEMDVTADAPDGYCHACAGAPFAEHSCSIEKVEVEIEEVEAEEEVIDCPACKGDQYSRHNHETWEDLHPMRETGFRVFDHRW